MSFKYDPAANSITIAQGTDSVSIVKNPDQSYVVGGGAAADGKAAVALLQGHAAYRDASSHSVMLAYSYAQRPSLEAGQPVCFVNCGGTGPTGCGSEPVRGWVVQRLSHKGEGSPECPICAPCDFTVASPE